MALRWGILSAGKISNDFVASMNCLDPKEHQVIAVGARNLKSAQEFAQIHNIPNAFGDYVDVAKRPDIDVIYVGSINPSHIKLVKLALDHGKHVLCEKPLGVNVRETMEMIEYSRKKKLFLMEAIWSRSFPAYQKIKEDIAKGTIGEVKQVFVTFGQLIAEQERTKLKELGGGSILDIGIYCIQFASLVFGGEIPLKVIAGGHINCDGVDESTSTTLIYDGGRTATLITNTKVIMPNDAYAFGTKGTIKLYNPFWCGTKLETPSGTIEFKLPDLRDQDKFFNYGNGPGLSYQCNEVRRCIKNGLLESPLLPHKETLLIAEIMESVRKQIGVTYPQDLSNGDMNAK